MKLKKMKIHLLLFILVLFLSSCQNNETPSEVEPQLTQMRAITELATIECYFHNVAKFKEKDAEGMLFWKKDKHFWIQYSGVVTLGIDVSQLAVEVDNEVVRIIMPKARVLRHRVDESSLSRESFIVEKNSAKISTEDEIKAFAEAQEKMVLSASQDIALLASAQHRAQVLLEEYINNIGSAAGKQYTIIWEFLDTD